MGSYGLPASCFLGRKINISKGAISIDSNPKSNLLRLRRPATMTPIIAGIEKKRMSCKSEVEKLLIF